MSNNMNANNVCPQCQKEVNESTNRMIQDACGHKKCRVCLLKDETECKLCTPKDIEPQPIISSNNNTDNYTTSVIKYDIVSVATSPALSQIVNNKVNTGKDDENIDKVTSATKTEDEIPKKPASKQASLPSHIHFITESPVLYKCTICTKSFSSHGSLKYHVYCGGGEKPLKCDVCQKGFVTRSHLESHKLKHSGIRPFKCSICQKSFVQKSKLNRHLKLHTGDRPFVCSECGKKFTNKDALTGHYLVHSGDKPFSCKYCGSSFNNKSNLSKHIDTHSKEKLYMCEDCGKKFGNKWALLSHKKSHSVDRPYNCQKCSKTFSNPKILKRHSLIHLDIKPFSCKLCNLKFCRKDNLERHLKNTHSIKDVSEIKAASTKTAINKKIVDSITLSNNKSETKSSSIKNACAVQSTSEKIFKEKPNAINVIKMSNESCQPCLNPTTVLPAIRNAVPVINGPFKLAFKTDAFKNNYNILNRDYTEPPPRIQTKKPYDMAESLNICQKILTPITVPPAKNENSVEQLANPQTISRDLCPSKAKNVIMSVGRVNEKESLEICKKILTPIDIPPLHYETSFEHKKHAVIKNIKFKLPSAYTNNALKASGCDSQSETDEMRIDDDVSPINSVLNDANYDDECSTKDLIELQPVKLNYDNINNSDLIYKQSVIVNPHTSDNIPKDNSFSEMHWRRRTSQNLQPKLNNT